jgi:phenylalanyl-tRNA synthetase beta chain
MKLHLSMLEKFLELSTKDPKEIRHLLDDTGLEVKGVEGEGAATIFNIETLANRGDTLSAVGMARDLSARLLTALKLPAVAASIEDRKSSVAVRKNTSKCLRYALLELVLPKGMELRSDIAAIMGPLPADRHAIVEVLNYIALELGQPMHAFDRERVDGEISIEALDAPEEIVALDGKIYKVPADSIVIRDRKKVLAVAGVIGCQNSMVTPETTRVVVESATFDPVSVRLTRRAMNISTDASYAFERGADIDAVRFALQRLVYLTVGAAGAVRDASSAQVLGLTYVEGEPTEKRKIPYSIAMFRQQLHAPRLTEAEVNTRLKYLGFGIEPGSEPLHFKATVPSWRLWDIRNPEDLVEEFVRVHGLNKVKLQLPALDYDLPELDPTETFLEAVEPALHGHGFCEIITKGFIASDDVRLLSELDPSSAEQYVGMKNSLESSYSHLKQSNILHMARVCEQNLRRGVKAIKVYEFGRVFRRQTDGEGRYEFERDLLSMAAAGRWMDTQWRKGEDLESLVFLFKGALDAVAASLGVVVSVAHSKHPLLHPGMQGALKIGRTTVGVFGVIHPLLQERIDLQERVVYAEWEVEKLCKVMDSRTYRRVGDLPSTWRDLTLKVGPRDLAGDTVRFIEECKPEHLARVEIVDDFKKPDESFRRVSYRLIFESSERTLEGAEIDTQMQVILAELKTKHSLELAL